MADVSPNTKTDALKRRSTRIVQAVPLSVTGVDALGRPFEERTSTSIINCHGCRYQSKHYVLKNMWVTLEVPHPEQGRPPRQVRARVMWIQRPRTVRELFQVGVELEVAGNFWGIAFCPPDWFPFPDSEAELHAPSPEAPALHEEPVEALPEAAEAFSGSREQVSATDNVREMPLASPATGAAELSQTLERQMERLVDEAKQQLRLAVREQAAEVFSGEAQPLLASLQNQLQEAVERSAQVAAATAAEQAVRNAIGNAEATAESRLRELIERSKDELGRNLEEYYQKLEARSGELGAERRESFEQQFQSQVQQRLDELAAAAADSLNTLERSRENLEALRRQAEESISAALRDGAQRLQAQADDGRTRASELENVLRHSVEQIAPVSASVQTDWKSQLDAETAAAAKRWDDRVEASLESAAQKVAERLAGTAQAEYERFEKELAERIAAISRTFTESTADAEARLATARASLENQAGYLQGLLAQVQAAAQPIAEQTVQLDALHQTAQQELERRAAALLDTQSQEFARRSDNAMAAWVAHLQPSLDTAQQELERRAAALLDSQNQELARRGDNAMTAWVERLQPSLNTAQMELERRAAALVEIQSQELARRGESAIATWTERLQPSLETAAQETVMRLGAQFEQHLGSHLDRAHHVIGRLEYESLAAGEAMLRREEALTTASNRIVEAATAQLQRQSETLEHDFQEAGRQAAGQWLGEIDSKATETTHATFESLFKTAEWYEKKVQTHMQTTLERGLEQGAEQLRDKAGEISRLFAGELDHYSRSYVEHAHDQIEEARSEALERTHKQAGEMTSASISALAQQMQSRTDAATHDFHAKTGAALNKLATQAEEQAGHTQARIEAAAQRLFIDFGTSIKLQAEQAIGSAKLELTSHATAARDSLRAEAVAREKHLREALASAGDQGIEAYKQRLESAANSWLLTTVSKLNQDSQEQLGTLTRAAEARLRDTCKQVFANVGEALRQQMLDLSVSPPAPPAKDSSNDKS